jgi:hypothetical protein
LSVLDTRLHLGFLSRTEDEGRKRKVVGARLCAQVHKTFLFAEAMGTFRTGTVTGR